VYRYTLKQNCRDRTWAEIAGEQRVKGNILVLEIRGQVKKKKKKVKTMPVTGRGGL
jgi:hypothetical protein